MLFFNQSLDLFHSIFPSMAFILTFMYIEFTKMKKDSFRFYNTDRLSVLKSNLLLKQTRVKVLK